MTRESLGISRLRQWRGDRTRREAARALGMPESTYWRIEEGQRVPSRVTALAIARGTGGMVALDSWDQAA